MEAGRTMMGAVDLNLGGPGGSTWQSSSVSSWLVSDVGIVVVVGLIVALLLFGWARFIRRPAGLGQTSSQGTGRRRKLRQEHRTRKPTLAETGGLPPVRDPEPSKGTSPQ